MRVGGCAPKAAVNSREQLESLFTAKEMGVASVQALLDGQATQGVQP